MSKFVKYAKLAVLALVIALPLVATVACTALKPKLDAGISAAQTVSKDAAVVLTTARDAAKALPPGPERDAIEKRIVQVEAIQKQADAYIAAAQGVEKSLDSGTLDPTAATAIGLLPYGSYAVAGISLVLAALQRAKANGTLADLETVVKSWESVGGPTPEQKPAVAAVQGAVLSAKVDAIKGG